MKKKKEIENKNYIEHFGEIYVSEEIAKLLRELGFDWKCSYQFIDGKIIEMLSSYSNSQMCPEHFAAPKIYDAQRWMREVLHIHIEVVIGDHAKDWGYYYFINIHEPDKMPPINGVPKMSKFYQDFESYEDALSDAMRKCLIERKVISSMSAEDWVTEANIEAACDDIN